MSRDEWPLLGLAIVHALDHHVDDLVVLDHGSVDATPAGLSALQAVYPGRLRVVRSDAPDYPQEAATGLLLQVGGVTAYDWVYVFDADEFLLAGPGGLRAVLAGAAADVSAVRYELHQWVAPTSFDEADLAAYPRLRHRAEPTVESTAETQGAIERAELSFFDVVFTSKVVVRASASLWIAAGTHAVTFPLGVHESGAPPEALRAAHLSHLSRARLSRKARLGQAHIDAGMPADHGWQNQMLRRLELRGELDEFWTRHSIPDDRSSAPRTGGPLVIVDDSLCEPMRSATVVLQACAPLDASVAPPAGTVEADVAMRAVAAAHDAGRELAALAGRALAHEGQLRQERDGLRADRARLESEAAGLAERADGLVRQRDRLAIERDRLASERDDLAAALHAVLRSRSWRLTAPLRAPLSRLRLTRPPR